MSPESRSRRPVRLPLAGLLGIAAAVLLSTLACKEPEVAQAPTVVRPVKLMTVGGAGAAAGGTKSFPGRVEALNQVDLSFRVGGPLTALPVKEGQKVRRGQTLARIDTRDFDIRLKSARAQAERTEADLRRFTALYEKAAISEAQLDQAQAAADVATAALADAEANLADTTLKAPFSGIIGETFVENFQEVRPKEPVLSLIDASRVKLVVDLPEFLVATARDPASFEAFARFDAAPGEDLPLVLDELAAQADPRTQTYRATLLMDQPEGIDVLPGMTANVYGSQSASGDDGAETSLVVPAIAVVADEGGNAFVWVVEGEPMKAGKRPVATGELAGSDSIEITSGLAAGETIAISAVSALTEGMEVRPLTAVSRSSSSGGTGS